jgi:hypothetical protein
MIRTFITPTKSKYNLVLDLPEDYLGQELELIVFKKQEGLAEDKKASPKKSMADFSGILSENDYQSLKAHTEQARKEWNRDI